MTAGQVAALYGIWVIAVISPGPDLVVVLHRSLVGRRHGVATAVGVVSGIAIWLAAAFAGLAALVRVYPQIMTGLQVAPTPPKEMDCFSSSRSEESFHRQVGVFLAASRSGPGV